MINTPNTTAFCKFSLILDQCYDIIFVNVSKLYRGNFSPTPADHMNEKGRYVPVNLLQNAIKYGQKGVDPQGSNIPMYYTTMYKNGKMYDLEVLYDESTNTVYHFKYTDKAIGSLPAIE